jgi:hypothetical protein
VKSLTGRDAGGGSSRSSPPQPLSKPIATPMQATPNGKNLADIIEPQGKTYEEKGM